MSEKMIFCLGEDKYESKGAGYQKHYQVFNQQVDEDGWHKIYNSLNIKLSLTHWVDKKDMTDEEKENNPVYKEIGGYLKVFTYKDAWKNWWNEAKQSEKDAILDIKYFDAEIFKGITGIDVRVNDEMVEIDGKKYSKSTLKEALREYVK